MPDRFDIIIVGAGPGGYIAALRAAQLGKRALLVEADTIGGTCMNWGCIPTKHLLHLTRVFEEVRTAKHLSGPREAIACDWTRVQEERAKAVEKLVKGTEFLLRKNGVALAAGSAALEAPDRVAVTSRAGGREVHEAARVLLASGSRSADLPFAKPDGERIITSREALELAVVPRSLVVIGAGAIGLELATVFRRMGTEVVVLEILPGVLPGSDREMAQRLERSLTRQGLKIRTRMKIEDVRAEESGVLVKGIDLKAGSPFEVRAEKVLVAAGRKSNSEFLRSGPPGLSIGRQGLVEVNAKLETGLPGVYAVGDLIGGKLLAHKASHEGIRAVENAFGPGAEMRYDALPMAVFTEPEYASVGLSEEEAAERGLEIRVGKFPLQASGRALTMESPDGLVKVLAARDGRLLGAHILAPHASEIIPELTLAVEKGLGLDDIGRTIHIHPTLSETVMEAALKAQDGAFHILNV
ncbi:MAG: dihydrolipoyl dehydrogenase [Candidatus Aminicenantes bacterium]|nr:dihydrolipoyl dehydrogenase [Candidatus Aminicenantes bacterium]